MSELRFHLKAFEFVMKPLDPNTVYWCYGVMQGVFDEIKRDRLFALLNMPGAE